jgi:hypothetical protein
LSTRFFPIKFIGDITEEGRIFLVKNPSVMTMD